MYRLLQILTDHGAVCVGAGQTIYVLNECTYRDDDDNVQSHSYWETIVASHQAVMHWLGY